MKAFDLNFGFESNIGFSRRKCQQLRSSDLRFSKPCDTEFSATMFLPSCKM